jgi:tetratricopeptide (TPR) repeat protein
LARSLEILGFDLRAAGHYERWLHVNEEAVELYQTIKQPAVTEELELAQTLNSFSASLHAVGRHDDAFLAHDKGVDIYHKLAETHPTATAYSLHELALLLRSCGIYEDALLFEEKAVELYRKIMKTKPRFVKVLIRSLGSLAGDLRALERDGEAARTDTEVAELDYTNPAGATDAVGVKSQR